MDPPLVRGIVRVKPVCLCLAVLALAGCGGGKPGGHTVTVSQYGPYPAATVSGKATPAACTGAARSLAHDGLLMLAHSGADGAYPADLYYVILREDFADFQGRGCDPRYLGAVLRVRLSASQRSALVADLPSAMAQVVRKGLSVTRP
jgi:hypothetical protein